MKDKTNILPEFADYPIYRGTTEIVDGNQSGFPIITEAPPASVIKPAIDWVNEPVHEEISV